MGSQTIEHLRRHWFFNLVQLTATGLAVYWWCSVPVPGYAVAVLAAMAAIMSIHGDMRPWHKAAWMLIIGGFLCVELAAIRHDRRVTDEKEKVARREERDSFREIIDAGNRNFAGILAAQQESFAATMRMLVNAQRQSEREFAQLLVRQQDMFVAQQEFSESLMGRLVPANDPTPPHACATIGPKENEVLVVLGNNASIVNRFPHTVLRINDRAVVSIDRVVATGAMALGIDSRDADGKISFRLDKNGAVVRDSRLFALRPDKSTFVIQDEYGNDIFRARFLNPKTFSVDGRLSYCGRTIPLQMPFLSRSCVAHSGGAEIGIDLPCPKQP